MTVAPEVELGHIAAFIRGITFKPEDVAPLGTPGTAACMRTKNVQSELDLSDVWGIPDSFVRREDQYLIPGDMLVSSANSWNLVGKCCWVPNLPWRSTFGGFISVLRPDPARVDPRYLFRWFSSNRTQATVRSFGQQTTNISNLNVERCLKLKLRLPPLPDQRRIAMILDKADALRAMRHSGLAEIDELIQSVFFDMFGDPATNPRKFQIRPLLSLVQDGDSINYGVVQPGDDVDAGVPLIRVGDLRGGRVIHSGLKRIDPKIEAEYKRSRLRGDEILVSCVGSIGVVALADETLRGFNIARAVARIPASPSISRTFLAAYLRTDFVQHYFTSELRTVSQPTLNIKQLSETSVMLPPPELQSQFEAKVFAIERVRASQLLGMGELDALFASVQNRAFRGEL